MLQDICTSMFIPGLFTLAKRWKHPMVHWRMDKQMWYTYNGTLFGLKKKADSDTCYSMVAPWWHYAQWNKLVTKDKYCLHEVHTVVKSWGQEVEWWLPGAARTGEVGGRVGSCGDFLFVYFILFYFLTALLEELWFNGYRFSGLQDERSSVAGWWWWLQQCECI